MPLHAIALVLLSSVACALLRASAPRPDAPEDDLVTRVRVFEEAPCVVPGRPDLTGQTGVRLVYVEWPMFQEEICSTDLATHLRRTHASEVEVKVAVSARGHALCAIDGITLTRLERGGCSFGGVISGGLLFYGSEKQGDDELTPADLPPWEASDR